MAETKKKKKPGYVAKADEVTKKVDKAVGDAVSKLPGARKKVSDRGGRAASTDYKVPQQDILSQRARKAKSKAPGEAAAATPKKAAGGARPEKAGSYPRKAQPMGTAFNGATPKASPSYDGKASSASPKTRKPAAKAGGGESDYYSGPKTRKPLSNPGVAGKTKQPVKAGQDPNAEWRRAQLTGQGDRWDATRGKKKREGSNR